MTGKPYITARQRDGQYRKIECEDYDDVYDKISYMMSHNDRWVEIHIWAYPPNGHPYSIKVYQEPYDAIQDLRMFVDEARL